MNSPQNKPSIFVPDKNKIIVPFMRDVFTIPRNSRHKPKLIGSVCKECEEYFFPKTGSKATCDNPVCPRSTSEVLLSGKGKLLSATVTRSSVEGNEERVSAVIFLDEGIKINSHLIDWEGYRDMLVPGSPVELVLQDLGENEWLETQVGYAFRLITGRRKPVFPPTEEERRAAEVARIAEEKLRKKETAKKNAAQKKRTAARKKSTALKKKAAAASKKIASAKRKTTLSKTKTAAARKKAATTRKTAAPQKTVAPKAVRTAAKKSPTPKVAAKKAAERQVAKKPAKKAAVKKTAPQSARKRR